MCLMDLSIKHNWQVINYPDLYTYWLTYLKMIVFRSTQKETLQFDIIIKDAIVPKIEIRLSAKKRDLFNVQRGMAKMLIYTCT